MSSPTGLEAWWSVHTFADDQRSGRNWQSSCAIALDLDYYATVEGDGESDWLHVAPPPELRERFEAVARELGVTLYHDTPRGCRLVWVLREQCTDPTRWSRAADALCLRVEERLRQAGALGDKTRAKPGLCVDHAASCDRARLLFTPRAEVGGTRRKADVCVLGELVELGDFGPGSGEIGGEQTKWPLGSSMIEDSEVAPEIEARRTEAESALGSIPPSIKRPG
ncbi:MAG: hypothetical protein KA020_10775, partial [Planctomycetes bacterium]|nr:hypothetical protein [Planctomycetota bacterium]